MIKHIILGAAFFSMLYSCSKDVVDPYDPFGPPVFHPVHLRVENVTGVDFTYVQVNNDTTFGPLAAGDTSIYHYTPEGAYYYGHVNIITAENDTLGILPLDFVGETPLETGYYTYRLYFNINGQDTILMNQFVVD